MWIPSLGGVVPTQPSLKPQSGPLSEGAADRYTPSDETRQWLASQLPPGAAVEDIDRLFRLCQVHARGQRQEATLVEARQMLELAHAIPETTHQEALAAVELLLPTLPPHQVTKALPELCKILQRRGHDGCSWQFSFDKIAMSVDTRYSSRPRPELLAGVRQYRDILECMLAAPARATKGPQFSDDHNALAAYAFSRHHYREGSAEAALFDRFLGELGNPFDAAGTVKLLASLPSDRQQEVADHLQRSWADYRAGGPHRRMPADWQRQARDQVFSVSMMEPGGNVTEALRRQELFDWLERYHDERAKVFSSYTPSHDGLRGTAEFYAAGQPLGVAFDSYRDCYDDVRALGVPTVGIDSMIYPLNRYMDAMRAELPACMPSATARPYVLRTLKDGWERHHVDGREANRFVATVGAETSAGRSLTSAINGYAEQLAEVKAAGFCEDEAAGALQTLTETAVARYRQDPSQPFPQVRGQVLKSLTEAAARFGIHAQQATQFTVDSPLKCYLQAVGRACCGDPWKPGRAEAPPPFDPAVYERLGSGYQTLADSMPGFGASEVFYLVEKARHENLAEVAEQMRHLMRDRGWTAPHIRDLETAVDRRPDGESYAHALRRYAESQLYTGSYDGMEKGLKQLQGLHAEGAFPRLAADDLEPVLDGEVRYQHVLGTSPRNTMATAIERLRRCYGEEADRPAIRSESDELRIGGLRIPKRSV